MDITATMMATVRGRTFPNATMAASGPGRDVVEMGRQNYAAKIERLDYWLGQYIQLLNGTGELDNTVICTSLLGSNVGPLCTRLGVHSAPHS
jgi:arylsulfatase A-like enzyme